MLSVAECNRAVNLVLRNWDVGFQEQEHSGEQSKLRQLPSQELLFQMPFLQKLLQRLLDCRPTGAASHDAVVQASSDISVGTAICASQNVKAQHFEKLFVQCW